MICARSKSSLGPEVDPGSLELSQLKHEHFAAARGEIPEATNAAAA